MLEPIVPKIVNDKWYQSILPHLTLRLTILPVIIPPYWDQMMTVISYNDYPSMIRYQESHVYNNMFEVRATSIPHVGQGVYVRHGVRVPVGTQLLFWGAIGHMFNPCLKHYEEGRQISLDDCPYPARFFTHPGCLARFVNNAISPLSNIPNCMLWLDQSNRQISLFLRTTKIIYGDGTENAQLLFKYS